MESTKGAGHPRRKPEHARLRKELGVWVYQGAPTKIGIHTVVTNSRNRRVQMLCKIAADGEPNRLHVYPPR